MENSLLTCIVADLPDFPTRQGAILRALRESNGLTLREAAAKLGMKLGQLVRREKDEARTKRHEVQTFAKVYNVPVEELQELLGFVATRRLARGIPVVNRAAAGYVVDYNNYQLADEELPAAYEYIERDMTTQGKDLFAIVVTGDSMSPTLIDGDYIVFDPVLEGQQDRLRDGLVVFIRFGKGDAQKGKGLLGRMVWSEGKASVRITNDNRNFPETTVHIDDLHIGRIAIAVQRRTKML